ncbi:MAG: UbiA family prenyltransferase [Actinomycetota bacterium]|nr:UbiA family prenyltransferase [Actinomycetota bacterium]
MLAAILSIEEGAAAINGRVVLITLSVLGSQIVTGVMNDWADRERDAVTQPSKPIPAGAARPSTALGLAAVGFALQVAASLPLGWLALVLGLLAVGSAVAYDLWLSRTIASFVPYLVSFGLLPLWIAAGVGVPLERVAAASLLVGPFAVAAHLANTLKDFEGDAAMRSGNLAQSLGSGRTSVLAVLLAAGVGFGAGVGLAATGRLGLPSLLHGVLGLLAIAQGIRSAPRLWAGMLVAAVSWTAAWALATA